MAVVEVAVKNGKGGETSKGTNQTDGRTETWFWKLRHSLIGKRTAGSECRMQTAKIAVSQEGTISGAKIFQTTKKKRREK